MEVYDAYPELYHYTGLEAFEAMIANPSLWATRFDRMNDRSEVVQLKEYLIVALKPYAKAKALEYMRGSIKRRRLVQGFGGLDAVAEKNARGTLDAVYKVSFVGDPGSPPHFVPYSFSFCAHTSDDAYVRENGLLSQWRAYGTPKSRIAMVIDAKRLSEMLAMEYQRYAFSVLRFTDVVYDDDKFDVEKSYPTLMQELRRHHGSYYESDPDFSDTKLPQEFIAAATSLKNRSFYEEREVRIVAIPLTQEIHEETLSKLGEDESQGRPLIPIRHRQRGNVDIPFISLLEGQGSGLPLLRVIVGPSLDQDKIFARVSELLNNSGVRVSKSVSPLVDPPPT